MNIQSIKLLGNRIIVIPEVKSDKTLGGIYIPDTLQEERNVGVIALIGETVDRRFEGRRAIFTRNTGEKITFDGLEAILLYSFDVIAFTN